MQKIIISLIIIAAIIVGFLASRTTEVVEEVIDEPVTSLENQPLPTSCTDVIEGNPVITSLSDYSVAVGETLSVNGCNFSGFEGDLDVWIESDGAIKGYIQGNDTSTNKQIVITLQSKLCQQNNSYSGNPCTAWLDLVPGTYKLYTNPWGKKSNEVLFEIK